MVSRRNRSPGRSIRTMAWTSSSISPSAPAVLPLVSRNSVTSIGTDSMDTASTVWSTALSVSAKSLTVRSATTALPRVTETLTETSVVVDRKTGCWAQTNGGATAAATRPAMAATCRRRRTFMTAPARATPRRARADGRSARRGTAATGRRLAGGCRARPARRRAPRVRRRAEGAGTPAPGRRTASRAVTRAPRAGGESRCRRRGARARSIRAGTAARYRRSASSVRASGVVSAVFRRGVVTQYPVQVAESHAGLGTHDGVAHESIEQLDSGPSRAEQESGYRRPTVTTATVAGKRPSRRSGRRRS